MNARCASAVSAASWDSIWAAEPTPLSPNEVGGLLARVNPSPEPASPPPLPPDSKRHARTRRNVRAWLSQMASIAHQATRQSNCWMNDVRKNPHLQICLFLLFFSGGQLRYYVVNFQDPHSKTKTADGRCVTPRRFTIGCFGRFGSSFPAFLLVEEHKACNSFDSSEVDFEGTAYQDERATDWPMTLSVLSRGNVFMFSLACQLPGQKTEFLRIYFLRNGDLFVSCFFFF